MVSLKKFFKSLYNLKIHQGFQKNTLQRVGKGSFRLECVLIQYLSNNNYGVFRRTNERYIGIKIKDITTDRKTQRRN